MCGTYIFSLSHTHTAVGLHIRKKIGRTLLDSIFTLNIILSGVILLRNRRETTLRI